MKAVLIPGDGIGKEIAESVIEINEALNTGIEWEVFQAGAEYHSSSGDLMEKGLLERINELGVALKGPTATPIGSGFRSINVYLRQAFSTYANLRPVHSIAGVPSRYENVDLVIVRENTEDLYKGIEYMYDSRTAHGIKLISEEASERIARFAFEYALKQGRKKVTAVHKANIMKLTDGLFLNTFRKVAAEYPMIESSDVIIDATLTVRNVGIPSDRLPELDFSCIELQSESISGEHEQGLLFDSDVESSDNVLSAIELDDCNLTIAESSTRNRLSKIKLGIYHYITQLIESTKSTQPLNGKCIYKRWEKEVL